MCLLAFPKSFKSTRTQRTLPGSFSGLAPVENEHIARQCPQSYFRESYRALLLPPTLSAFHVTSNRELTTRVIQCRLRRRAPQGAGDGGVPWSCSEACRKFSEARLVSKLHQKDLNIKTNKPLTTSQSFHLYINRNYLCQYI